MSESTTTTPNDSPVPVQPLHNPSQAAHVVVPQAPLGTANIANQAPGMGAKALLAKKMAKSHNPNFVSPTDNLMTPCTQKLSAAKKKHFAKTTKPVQLFATKDEGIHAPIEEEVSEEKIEAPTAIDDDENPF